MEKGPHIALEVAHRLSVPMKFIGKRVEPHEQAYFDKFIEPSLGPNDEVLGLVGADEKAELYRGAKATMMTNLWAEPFGLVVAESMASGTPVVGPALGSLTELIEKSGVLIPVEDLNLDENDTEVTNSQRKFIDRIVEYMGRLDSIPPQVPRKRAEFLFSSKHNVDGYEEAFLKAMYLEEKKNKALI
jgi:glycosyltransferase involved in cell wall biosynthesis